MFIFAHYQRTGISDTGTVSPLGEAVATAGALSIAAIAGASRIPTKVLQLGSGVVVMGVALVRLGIRLLFMGFLIRGGLALVRAGLEMAIPPAPLPELPSA